MGWWIIPVVINILCVWAVLDANNTPTRGFSEAVTNGVAAAVVLLFGIIISIISWLIYFIVF